LLLSRILFGKRFSSIRCMWPAHCSLFNLIIFYFSRSSNCPYISLLYLILHVLFSLIGWIFFSILPCQWIQNWSWLSGESPAFISIP
jgi:hypothetical protein